LDSDPGSVEQSSALVIRRLVHRALLRVQDHYEKLRFNTAIAEIRKLTNALNATLGEMENTPSADEALALREAADVLVVMFSPVMPHLAEECWSRLGHKDLLSDAAWPTVIDTLAQEDTIVIPVQINGKKRAEISVPRDIDNESLERLALKLEPVVKALENHSPKKVIIVPQRIVNVVV
jgi:leucyl-tRNA synthetase